MVNPRTILAWIACVALAGCAGGGNGEDTGTDADAPVDMTEGTDVPVDTEEDGDAVADPTDEDAPPAACEGSESFTLEFLDPDDAPLEGVEVVLVCGTDMSLEQTSGSDGRVTFEGLNLSATPVDFTYWYDDDDDEKGVARTWLGAGGPARTLPDPLSLNLGREEEETLPTMTGDLVHSATDSYILVFVEGGGADVTQEDRYEVDTMDGTGLTLYAIEWTSTGAAGTPVGYQVLTYDTPTGGADGPTVGPCSSSLSTNSFTVTFDVDPENSSILAAELPTDEPFTNRLISGARLSGLDADEDFHFFGMTMNWSGGFSTPTVDVAWIPEGLTNVTEPYLAMWLVDNERNSWAIFPMPDDPTTWSTFTVNDAPTMGTLDMHTRLPFNTEIPVEPPDWAEMFMTYHLRLPDSGGAIFQETYQWVVIVHPETTSFRFSDLPLPSTVDHGDVLFSGITHRLGVSARAYDADPYADYVLYTDDTWAETHHLGSMGDSRYQMIVPD